MTGFIFTWKRITGLILSILGLITIIFGWIYSRTHFYIGGIISLLGMIPFLVGVGIITYKIHPSHVINHIND